MLAILCGSASAQGLGTWQFPVVSAVAGTVGSIAMPGKQWPAGTPMDVNAYEEPVAIVSRFYAALATANLAAASQFICAGDRTLFASQDAASVVSYLQTYSSRERVAVIQYPTVALVFVRLIATDGSKLLKVLELLPPAADPILHVYPPPPRRTQSCITQLDEVAESLRDLLAATMPELHSPVIPNPFPNGVPR